jgi:hypothetical protein
MYIMSESPVLGTPVIQKKTKDKIRCEAVLQTAGDVNRNKRRYSKTLIEDGISKVRDRLKEGSFLGELDHPISDNPVRQMTVLYKEASHRILEMGWDGNKLIGVVESLKTPNGQIFKNLAEEGIPVGFSFRGIGDLKSRIENGVKINEVVGPLHVTSWDAVSVPSHMEAKMIRITEGDIQAIQESACMMRNKTSRSKIAQLQEAYNLIHDSDGIVECGGMICTNEGICYLPNDFDKLVENHIIGLIKKFNKK